MLVVLLDGCRGPVPLELVNDGDLLLLIDRMLRQRGFDTVLFLRLRVMLMMAWFFMVVFVGKISWVMTLLMRLLILDVGESVLLSLMLVVTCLGFVVDWYPIILDLHRFFIAVSRAVVNLDGRGGTAPDPLVWSAGPLHKRRRLVHAVRDRAFLPVPPGIWHSEWFQVPAAAICAEDIALWPYTPGLLVKWVSFLNSLHWPVGDLDLGVGGVSYVELLIHVRALGW